MKLVCLLLPVAAVFAVEPQMTWEGELSKKVTIRIAADRITRGCQDCAVFSHSLPEKIQAVSAEVVEGQAQIYFARQPDASNGFTAELVVEPVAADKQLCRIHFYWDIAPAAVPGPTPPPRITVRGVLGTIAREAAAGMLAPRSGGLRWSGRVDGEVRVICRENHCKTILLDGAPVADVTFQFNQPLPRWDVTVSLTESRGRGRVWVAQQPSATNNWAAIVRIRDDQAGPSGYEFRLAW